MFSSEGAHLEGACSAIRNPADAERNRSRWTSSADLLTVVTVVFTLAGLSYFREILNLAQGCLATLVILRISFVRDQPTFRAVDHCAFVSGWVALARLLIQPADMGLARATASLTGVLLYWALRTTLHRRTVAALIGSLLNFGTAGLCIAWFPVCYRWIRTGRDVGFHDLTSLKARLFSPWNGLINEWASVVVLIMIFSVLWVQPRHSAGARVRPFAVFPLFIVSSALFLTFSRAGYIAFGLLTIALLSYSATRVENRRILLKWAAVIVLVPASAGVLSNVLSGGAVLRTATVVSTEQQRRSISGRFQVWSGAVDIARGRWLLGVGPGTFAMHYVPEINAEDGQDFVGRPLNTALGLLVEEGLLGLAVHGLVLITAASGALSYLRRRSSPASFSVAALVMAVGVFWLKEMTFSSFLEEPLVMCLYWILLALLVNLSTPTHSKPRGNAKAGVIMVVGLAVAAVGLVVTEMRSRRAEVLARAAAVQIDKRDLDTAEELVRSALDTNPVQYYRSLRALLGGLRAMPLFQAQDPFPTVLGEKARSELERALADYNQAIEFNPNDDLFWHNRAWIRLTLDGRRSDAIPDFQRAIQIDGSSAPYRIALGLLYEQEGHTQLAVDQYAMTIAIAPAVLDSPFARDLRARAPALFEAALRSATRRLETSSARARDITLRARLARLYLEGGQRDRANVLVSEVVALMPQYPRPWTTLARLQFDSHRLAAAENSLRKSQFLDPSDPIVSTVLAWIAREGGNDALAAIHQERAEATASRPFSTHATRVSRVYKVGSVVRDDILPSGLLAYCAPAFATVSRHSLSHDATRPERK